MKKGYLNITKRIDNKRNNGFIEEKMLKIKVNFIGERVMKLH